MLNRFGAAISGTSFYGPGEILTSHRITQGVTSPYIAKSGQLTMPASAIRLILDYYLALGAAVMEQTTEVGNGRLFAIGDCGMFCDTYMSAYPDNVKLAENIADWALNPSAKLRGHVDVNQFAGDITGKAIQLTLYDGEDIIETVVAYIDTFGNYEVPVVHTGPCDIVAKMWQWLAVRQDAIQVDGVTTVDWYFPINGDANNDNAVDLVDINAIMLNFGASAPNDADVDGDGLVALPDLNVVLLSFGQTGA
jgi:hypothetical protein